MIIYKLEDIQCLRFYHINKELVKNAYLIDKYKDDATIIGMIIRVAIPLNNTKLKLDRNFLIRTR